MQVSRKAIRLGLMIQSRVREIIRQLEPSLYQHLHAWGLQRQSLVLMHPVGLSEVPAVPSRVGVVVLVKHLSATGAEAVKRPKSDDNWFTNNLHVKKISKSLHDPY
jgi:hypothetical protein